MMRQVDYHRFFTYLRLQRVVAYLVLLELLKRRAEFAYTEDVGSGDQNFSDDYYTLRSLSQFQNSVILVCPESFFASEGFPTCGNLRELRLTKGYESNQPTPAPLPRGDFRDNDTEKDNQFPDALQSRPQSVRDNLHRLTAEANTNSTYSYNEIGNIKTKTAGAVSYDYIYDDKKIHSLKNLIVDGEAYNLGYNQRDVVYNAELMPRQINITKADNSTQTIDIMYDSDSVRAKKTSPLGTTYYIGNHLEKINDQLNAYIFAGDLRIAKITSSGTFFYYKDHLGSTLAMTTANGDEVETVNYTPYGEDRNPNHPAYSSNYLFTDQELDPETGLYNYDARLYDPIVGRFISADNNHDLKNPLYWRIR
jgi:RHS repeat-associated protein